MTKRKIRKSDQEEREPTFLDGVIAVVIVVAYFGLMGYMLWSSLSDPPDPYHMDIP
jgi:hypothetical protein